MKPGDVVRFKTNTITYSWGQLALVKYVRVTSSGTGQVGLMNCKLGNMTVPWLSRDKYIEVVIAS